MRKRGMSMYYTVGETARRLGVAASTLRYYDKEGLLPFVERSSGGIRMFKESDFEWLSIIECLKKAGMPIKEIRKFIDWCLEGDSTIEQRLQLIQEQKRRVEEQIVQMQETLGVLEYKEWYYEKAKEAGTCRVHENLKKEEIPEKLRNERDKAKGVQYIEEEQ